MSTTHWSFQQLCDAAGEASSTSGVSSRLLPALRGNDLGLMAGYLVRTKRAVREGGILKVMPRRGEKGRRWNAAYTEISETDKDLLRLRCTGEALFSCELFGNFWAMSRPVELCFVLPLSFWCFSSPLLQRRSNIQQSRKSKGERP